MRERWRFAALALVWITGSGFAQTIPVATTGGAPNTIPVFSDGVTLSNSNIVESNGFVGIGNPNPLAPLSVWGNVFIGPLSYHGDASLQIAGQQGCCGRLTQIEAMGPNTDAINLMKSNDVNGAPHYWTWGVQQGQWTLTPGPSFQSSPTAFTINEAGNVGIGTPTPGAALEIHNGNVLISGQGASVTFPDGSVQSTAWNGTTLGGDYAEAIDILGERAEYTPGDVIVIDSTSPGKFAKSDKAYSRMVAGVYSTKPGLVGRRLTVERIDKAAEVPLAMVGIVPTKVSAENGAIEPGDLLVSASKPGYAMKGTDASRLTGAVLGKALAPLQSGYGVIEVMISIQ